jgi:ribosome-associated toxin RatA of RatAB toxin-antitoxin module
MIEVKKSVIVAHTTQTMFNLVADFKNYSKYLPWCTSSELISEQDNVVVGAIHLEYLKVKMHFVTRNTNTPYSTIKIDLVDGPFKELHGLWQFVPLGETGCKINFSLNYKFANLVLEKLISPVFNLVSKNIVECFIKEANKQSKS